MNADIFDICVRVFGLAAILIIVSLVVLALYCVFIFISAVFGGIGA